MITFTTEPQDGRSVAGVVISNENLVNLVSGLPIAISGERIGLPPGTEFRIYYMERDEFIEMAEKQGILNDKTNVVYKG